MYVIIDQFGTHLSFHISFADNFITIYTELYTYYSEIILWNSESFDYLCYNNIAKIIVIICDRCNNNLTKLNNILYRYTSFLYFKISKVITSYAVFFCDFLIYLTFNIIFRHSL